MTNWEEIKNILSDIFTTIDKNESRLQELVKINKDPMGNGDRSMAAQELAFANDCLDRIEALRTKRLSLLNYGKNIQKRISMAEEQKILQNLKRSK